MEKIIVDRYTTHIISSHQTKLGYFARIKQLIDGEVSEAYLYSPANTNDKLFVGVTPKHAFHNSLVSADDLSFMCKMGLNEDAELPIFVIFDALTLLGASCRSWMVYYLRKKKIKLKDTMRIRDLLALLERLQVEENISLYKTFIKINIILNHQTGVQTNLTPVEKRLLRCY